MWVDGPVASCYRRIHTHTFDEGTTMARTVTIGDSKRLALRFDEVEMISQAMHMIRSAVDAGNFDEGFWIGEQAEVDRWETLSGKLAEFYENA